MNANGFSLDQLRFKRLNRQTMQSRRAVEQHRMTLGHFIENVPDLRGLTLDHLFRAAYRVHIAEVFQPSNNERFEKHERHLLRQTALVQLELRANDNNRAARVSDTFAEQVSAKTASLALEHVAQRFERAIARACHRAAMSAVVEQSIHGFLQHALFVANNHVRRLKQKQVLKPVVAVDHPPIKIVQIRGGKTPALQRHQGAQIRRNHRQYIENHPLGTRVRVLESLNELETLGQFLADLFALGGGHRFLQLFVELVKVDLGEKLLDCFRAHAGDEIFAVLLLRLTVLDFVQQLRLLQRRLARIN